MRFFCFLFLFLPVIKFAFIHPPTLIRMFIFNRAMKYHVNENFKVSRKHIIQKYYYYLIWFIFSMISFHKFYLTETKYTKVVEYFLKL